MEDAHQLNGMANAAIVSPSNNNEGNSKRRKTYCQSLAQKGKRAIVSSALSKSRYIVDRLDQNLSYRLTVQGGNPHMSRE